jgi:hypothetical protein
VTDDTCKISIACCLIRHSYSYSIILKISILGLLLAASSFAIAAGPKLNPNTCGITDEDATGLNGDLSTNIQALRDYRETIAGLLEESKFKQLDCLADRFRSSKERFPGGGWKLYVLYEGLESPVQYPQHPTGKDWNVLLRRLKQWVAFRPRSLTARVALASAYVDYAWDARGYGYIDTVSESGSKLFGERIAEARRILEQASALPTKCPEWYLAMQRVAESEGWSVAEARGLFDEGSKFEPGYYYSARVFAYYLQPKWGGEAGDTEKFTLELADRIGGDQGDFLYFQLATSLLCGCGDEPHLSWPRIKRGFEASERLYGVSMLNLNQIAFLASRYGELDAVMADQALTRIGEQWHEETWKNKETFETTKKWAASYAPAAAQHQAMEEDAKANMQTPEGLHYKASFEKTYREFVQQCVQAEGPTLGKFETLTKIGATGTVEDVKIYWNGPTAMCVYQKLHTLQQEKATPFPPPPQAPYWVRLDLDGEQFAAVTSK